MATQTVPQAVPFQQPTGTITQEKLAYVLTLKGEIAERKKALEEAETEVQAALEDSVPVESGLLRAFLKIIERRSVPWKQVVERKLGVDFAKRVLAGTKPDKFTHLVVTA
jgi:hypothetical protein